MLAYCFRYSDRKYQVLLMMCTMKTQREIPSAADAFEPRNEEYFRMIVENADDFFAVLDLEGRRLYNSPSYANLFGDIESMKGSDSFAEVHTCLLYTSPSPRDGLLSRMPS